MDEMIELFSVINHLQKGALGLFFELNYMIGVFLTGYTTWFTFKFDPPVHASNSLASADDFKDMYNFIYFQYCYLYFSLIMLITVTLMYRKMDKEAQNMKKPINLDDGPKGGEQEM